MNNLTGNYRGTNTKVNYNDIEGRKNGTLFLKEVFDWDVETNTNQYGIDLLRKNGRGGIDVEEGKWSGLYRNQNPQNFNYFTIDFPTCNIPAERKEKYFNEKFNMVSKYGNPYVHHSPDYEYNSVLRFNVDFTECFFVDYSSYSDPNKLVRGTWKTYTVSAGRPENWLCWRLKDVPFFIRKDGKWIQDKTMENTEFYEKHVEQYLKSKQNNNVQ